MVVSWGGLLVNWITLCLGVESIDGLGGLYYQFRGFSGFLFLADCAM